jgi:hypothetical protein
MQHVDAWTEIALHYLTPRSLGLLERVSKTVRRAVKDPRVWQRQAVLAWNGFYDLKVPRVDAERFLAARLDCRVHFYDDVPREWLNWSDILCVMDCVRSFDYVTEDPKEVTMYELAKDWRTDDDGNRGWVYDLRRDYYRMIREWELEAGIGLE